MSNMLRRNESKYMFINLQSFLSYALFSRICKRQKYNIMSKMQKRYLKLNYSFKRLIFLFLKYFYDTKIINTRFINKINESYYIKLFHLK